MTRPRTQRLAALTLSLAIGAWPASAAAEEAPPMGLFDLYAANRAEGRPNYITADFVLLGYSLVRRASLADLEDTTLIPGFTALIEGLGAALGTAADPVTQANRDYLALLAALLTGSAEGLTGAAGEEYALVTAGAGIAPSPLFQRPLDYSQFQVRGRYTSSEALGGYFRAARYAGSVPFLVLASPATGTSPEAAMRMSAQALQLARIIDSDPELAEQRAALDRQLAWQLGSAEDLTDADLLAVSAEGDEPAGLPARLLEHARATGRQPSIIDTPVDHGLLGEGHSAADVLTGWRLLPARYTPESAAFQGLVFSATGDYRGPADATPFGLGHVEGRAVKAFPRVAELLAALGSEGAALELEAAHETAFDGYPEARREAAARLGAAQGLSGAHLRLMRLALREDDGRDRRTALAAFWTWQRYLEVLYAKQSNTLVGKGIELETPRPGALLEPAGVLYLGLAHLANLQARQTGDARWERLAEVIEPLVLASFRADQGLAPDADTERMLNRLDRDLLALAGTGDAPIVVDVHTHAAEGLVLEEAVGWAIPVERERARGARLRHYELKQPLSERLTDAAWRQRLASDPPAPPSAEPTGHAAAGGTGEHTP